MAIVIDNRHEIGDTVFLKTDPDQLYRMIMAFKVFKDGELLYELVQGTISSYHYDFEISTERNILVDK